MLLKRYRQILLDFVALLESFVRQPLECFRLLRALPEMLRGSLRARDWATADFQKSSTPSTSQSISEATPNPFAVYFQSHTEGRGIWKYTHYLDVYYQHLAKFIGKEVHVLEIGIYSGGSLEMWKSCFGPNCKVYGVDIREECKVYEKDGVEIFIGDQEDPKFWEHFKQMVPKVDVLIDDGGHLAGQQIVTLEEMLPHLQPGGVFLCEDVITIPNKFPGYIYGLCRHLNAYAYRPDDLEVDMSSFQRSIHSVHVYPYLTVIEKSASPVDHFSLPMHGTEWRPIAAAAAARSHEMGLK